MCRESVEPNNGVDLSELLDWLLPMNSKTTFDQQETPIRSFIDENGQLWLETDELGIFSVDFFIALVMAENLSGGCDEHQ